MRGTSPSRIGRLLLATCLVLFLRLANAADFVERLVIPILADDSALLIGIFGSLLGGIALARPVVRRLCRPIVPSEVAESRRSRVDRAGGDARIVRRIGRVSKLVAGVGVAFGLAWVRLVPVGAAEGRAFALGTFLLPLATGLVGYGAGLAGTCALMPASFLTGPMGRPYLAKVGTGNVLVARVACVLFLVVFVVPILFVMGLLLAPPLDQVD